MQLAITLFVLIVFLLVALLSTWVRQSRFEAYKKRGLTREDGWYVGERGDTAVGISIVKSEFRARPNPPVPVDITISQDVLGPTTKRLLPSTRDVEIGDPVFDKYFHLKGNDAELRALLSPRVREMMKELRGNRAYVRSQVTVRFGAVFLQPVSDANRVEHFDGFLDALLRLTHAMSRPVRSTALRLVANLDTETLEACQRGTVNALFGLRTTEATQLASGLLQHSKPMVRCLAACELGKQGIESLRALASGDDEQSSESVEAAVRVIAIQGLAKHRSDVSVEFLRALATDDSPVVRYAAMSVLAQFGEGPAPEQRVGGLAVPVAVGADGGLALSEAAEDESSVPIVEIAEATEDR